MRACACLFLWASVAIQINTTSSAMTKQSPLYVGLKLMGERIADLQDQLPDDWIERQGDEDIAVIIDTIEALEGEWLVTTEQRQAFGSFEYTDEDKES